MSTEMYVENGFVIVGKCECRTCYGQGTVPTPEICPTCNGSGRGKRGKRGGCRQCNGSCKVYNHDVRKDCPDCTLKGLDPHKAQNGSIYDYLPESILHAIPVKVYRHNRQPTGNEMYLGFDTIGGISEDYGRSFGVWSDEQYIADWHNGRSTQAVQVVKTLNKNTENECYKLPDHIGLFVHRGGYSARPVHDINETMAKLARERPSAEYMAVGMAMAGQGMNGTLGAIYR